MTVILNGTKEDIKKLALITERSRFNHLALIDNYLIKEKECYKVVKSRNWESGKIITKNELNTYIE